MKKSLLRILSIIFLALGVLAGMILFTASTWADVESVFYGFNRYGNKVTTVMHCPMLITSQETGTLTATFKNPSDQRTRPTVRFQASNTGLFRTETTRLSMEPGQSQTVEWTVTSADMVLNRLIFAKIYTYASYPLEDIEQTCGILVIDLPGLSGGQITAAFIALGLLGMGLGCLLWWLAGRPLKFRQLEAMRAMLTLSAVVILGMLSAIFSWWPLGILLTALALILTGVIIGSFVTFEKS
jgi:hypothetical protein